MCTSRERQSVLFATTSIPAIGPIQHSVQLVKEALLLGINEMCVKVTIYFHLVLQFRIHGILPPHPSCIFMTCTEAQG
jgi:hypothetical protein